LNSDWTALSTEAGGKFGSRGGTGVERVGCRVGGRVDAVAPGDNGLAGSPAPAAPDPAPFVFSLVRFPLEAGGGDVGVGKTALDCFLPIPMLHLALFGVFSTVSPVSSPCPFAALLPCASGYRCS
jgi:hypothetical protein